MSTMISEVYEAFIKSGCPDNLAKEAAIALSKETKLDKQEIKENFSDDLQEIKENFSDDLQEIKFRIEKVEKDIQKVEKDIQKLDKELAILRKDLSMIKWMLGIIILAVVIPIFRNLFGL